VPRLVLAGVLAGCTPVAGPGTTPERVAAEGTVVEVVDGDTVVLRIEGRTERVRLLGVDTPETVHPDRPVECHGPESSALLHQLLPPGTVVTLGRDVQVRDPYDRLLLFLTRSDGLLVNEELLRRGAADVLVIEPNGVLADRFRAAAADARAAGAGLWGRCGGLHEPADAAPPGTAVPLPP
jgi:micrococcal nuclease